MQRGRMQQDQLLFADLTNDIDHYHHQYHPHHHHHHRHRPSATLQLLGSMERSASSPPSAAERIERLVAENAVVVFSVSSCCMCHVVKQLFCSMGVSPTVVELDKEAGAGGVEMEKALVRILGERPAVPSVFVGGKLIGSLDRLMASHISGSLIPQLKEAGALWL